MHRTGSGSGLRRSVVWLKAQPALSVSRGHPWVFANAIEKVVSSSSSSSSSPSTGSLRHPPSPALGEVVSLVSPDGAKLGEGLYNPSASLRVRVYTRDPSQALNDALMRKHIANAIEIRKQIFPEAFQRPSSGSSSSKATDSFRLLYGESDGMSGLIVDKYADHLVFSVSAKVIEKRLHSLVSVVQEELIRAGAATGDGDGDGDGGGYHIHVKDSSKQRDAEALSPSVLERFTTSHQTSSKGERGGGGRGRRSGGDASAVRIAHGGLSFLVNLFEGQKTGFFLDQWRNRQLVARYAAGRDVLSCYCYTGGFELAAAQHGAKSIVGVDSSAAALEAAQRHHEINGTAASQPLEYIRADVPELLRKYLAEGGGGRGRQFDLIVLDPPKLVAALAHKKAGMRAYKDVNMMAMRLLRPGGILATFSCSGLVSSADFLQTIRWAATDAGKLRVRVLETLGHPPDHPVLLSFPEGEYLKGFILAVE